MEIQHGLAYKFACPKAQLKQWKANMHNKHVYKS